METALQQQRLIESRASGMSRRNILVHLAAATNRGSLAATSKLTGVLGAVGALALAPRRAHAQVETALMIGSAVVGFLASRKKSDSGLGAMVKATLEYQRILSDQIASLQVGMIKLLQEVEALPAKFQALLYAAEIKRVRTDVGAYLRRYEEEIRDRASQFADYQKWKKAPNTKENCQSILFGLKQSIATLAEGRQCDVVTAFYMPSAAFAALNLCLALDEPMGPLKATANSFLIYFEQFEDAKNPASPAGQLQAHLATAAALRKELADLGAQLPTDGSLPLQYANLGEIAVHDYLAPIEYSKTCKNVYVKSGGGGMPKNPNEGGDNIVEVCTEVQARTGRDTPVQVFRFNLGLSVVYPTIPGTPGVAGPLRQYQVARDIEIDANAKASKELKQEFIDASTPASRLAYAKSSPVANSANTRAPIARDRIASLNATLALIALHSSALADLQTARLDLFKFFGVKA